LGVPETNFKWQQVNILLVQRSTHDGWAQISHLCGMPELEPSEEELRDSIRYGATCTQRRWKKKGNNSICFLLFYGVRRLEENG